MSAYNYMTVDVFAKRRFEGNQLAVFPAADGIDAATMQALATEMNYSETIFVQRPVDAANSARVRIFHRSAEMPFAGHPNVGAAFALAHLGISAERVLRFEQLAGLVEVRVISAGQTILGAEIDAPQALSIAGALPADKIAECLSIEPSDIALERHSPVRASVGVEFVIVEVRAEALAHAAPDLSAFRRLAALHPELAGRLSILAWTEAGADVRARMFAPLSGTWEDPATGSANAALAALRLSLSSSESLAFECLQGVEMRRPSHLRLRAWRGPDGLAHASVGGDCVAVFRGAIDL